MKSFYLPLLNQTIICVHIRQGIPFKSNTKQTNAKLKRSIIWVPFTLSASAGVAFNHNLNAIQRMDSSFENAFWFTHFCLAHQKHCRAPDKCNEYVYDYVPKCLKNSINLDVYTCNNLLWKKWKRCWLVSMCVPLMQSKRYECCKIGYLSMKRFRKQQPFNLNFSSTRGLKMAIDLINVMHRIFFGLAFNINSMLGFLA